MIVCPWWEILILVGVCLSIGAIIGIFTIAMCQAGKKGDGKA